MKGPSEQSKTTLMQNKALMVRDVEAAEELQQELQKYLSVDWLGITKNVFRGNLSTSYGL